jgi:retron-type reverse transcriptase
VDIDLEKYFDTVNHDLLIKMVRETVKDEPVISLIRKFLKSGVMVDGLMSQSEQGTPQGGLCSAEHTPPYAQRLLMYSVRPKYRKYNGLPHKE